VSASTDSGSRPEPTASGSQSHPSSHTLDAWLDLTGQRLPDDDSQRWVSYNVSDLYPDWQADAHCAGVGVQYYFGESIQQVRRASKLCDVCPVFYQCLEHALVNREGYGVWAGTSGRMRRRIFKMVDDGQTTVAEVMEVFHRGEGDRYRLGPDAGQATGSLAREALGASPGSIRPEVGGALAL
jgi:hypothetical protein